MVILEERLLKSFNLEDKCLDFMNTKSALCSKDDHIQINNFT